MFFVDGNKVLYIEKKKKKKNENVFQVRCGMSLLGVECHGTFMWIITPTSKGSPTGVECHTKEVWNVTHR